MDVKPDNIYTWGEFEGERDMARVYKLGDFGQATRFDCRQAMNVIEGDSRWVGSWVACGWMALSKFRCRACSLKPGVRLLHELWTGVSEDVILAAMHARCRA